MKLLHLLVLAVALSVSALPALAADTPSAPEVADLTRAHALIAKKDWNGAVTELRRAARIEPDSADVHNLLGYSYRNAGQTDKAFGEYAIALKLDPRHRGAHEYVGVAYLIVKQPDKAREHLATLKTICGENCEEYQDLSKAIAAYKP